MQRKIFRTFWLHVHLQQDIMLIHLPAPKNWYIVLDWRFSIGGFQSEVFDPRFLDWKF